MATKYLLKLIFLFLQILIHKLFSMKRKIQVLSLLLLILSTICFGQNSIDIIPQRLSVKLNNNTTFKYKIPQIL